MFNKIGEYDLLTIECVTFWGVIGGVATVIVGAW